jgi:hypothetical protein
MYLYKHGNGFRPEPLGFAASGDGRRGQGPLGDFWEDINTAWTDATKAVSAGASQALKSATQAATALGTAKLAQAINPPKPAQAPQITYVSQASDTLGAIPWGTVAMIGVPAVALLFLLRK